MSAGVKRKRPAIGPSLSSELGLGFERISPIVRPGSNDCTGMARVGFSIEGTEDEIGSVLGVDGLLGLTLKSKLLII